MGFPKFTLGRQNAAPNSISLQLEQHVFQPSYNTTELIQLEVRRSRPQNVQLWQQLEGDDLLGQGYVLRANGELRSPDAYSQAYRLELDPDGRVLTYGVDQAVYNYAYAKEGVTSGMMLWDHINPHELAFSWFRPRAADPIEYSVIYWPPEVTSEQHAAVMQIAQTLSHRFKVRLDPQQEYNPWCIHIGKRAPIEAHCARFQYLFQLAKLAHGELLISDDSELITYCRNVCLPGLSMINYSSSSDSLWVLEYRLLADVAWLAAVGLTSPPPIATDRT